MFSINDFKNYKEQNKKITMITAYDYLTAQILEKSGVDTILVGDSLGMVFAGGENTLPVKIKDMIYHAKAVKRGAPNTFIIVDMPYLSYHVSLPISVKNAGKILQKTNCNAIKIEVNSKATFKHIRAIIKAQIPVVAHIGMTPQSVNIFGGFKIQGKSEKSIQLLTDYALELQAIGVNALVLECIPQDIATQIHDQLYIPTIGIGAGVNCDGQVLVFHDLLGYQPTNKIKFVKKFANAHEYLSAGVKSYLQEVRTSSFPNNEYSY